MPDISKCDGEGCPMKDTCYRFTAIADEHWQSYFMNAPIKENNTCDHYWPNEKENGTKILSKENSKRRGWHY